MRKILFLFTLILLAACKTENSTEGDVMVKEERRTLPSNKTEVVSPTENDASLNNIDPTVSNQKSVSKYSYKVIYDEQTGWGYQIFDGSKVVINQMHIPAVQGIQGFSSQKKAKKTAEYVVKQIEKGNFPPTLSKEILDSLNVL